MNVAVHAKSTTYVWQDFANFGIGFLISGISSMTGYGIAGLADKAGFIWGGLIGGLSGAGIAALTSPLQTGLNNLVAGSPFGRNMGKNVTTDILMGFFSGFISGSIQGVLKAKSLGLSWWDGSDVLGRSKITNPLMAYVDGVESMGSPEHCWFVNTVAAARPYSQISLEDVAEKLPFSVNTLEDLPSANSPGLVLDALKIDYEQIDDLKSYIGITKNMHWIADFPALSITKNPSHVRVFLSVKTVQKVTAFGKYKTIFNIQYLDLTLPNKIIKETNRWGNFQWGDMWIILKGLK